MTQTFSNNQPNVNNSNVVLAAQPSEMGAKEMSSLEIAELTGKQHAHVMRDIRNMVENMKKSNESTSGLVDCSEDYHRGDRTQYKYLSTKTQNAILDFAFGKNSSPYIVEESSYVDDKGETRNMYKLNKKACLLLASGYSVSLRAKIIDRWESLETGHATPAYQKMPTAKELALMVIQAEEEKERLMLENKAQQEVIESQKPAVVFTSAVQAAVNSCLVGELAKILQQNGVNIGEKRLFKWLRENKYLGSHGERYNIPNQEYIERGYFELKKGTRSGDNGVMHTTITTKVTGKGQVYFVNKFLANKVKED